MASGSTTKTVLGTLFIIVLLIVLVMGGLFVYKRFYAKPDFNMSIHFENTRSAMEAARVKMGKLNEIMINRNNNNNNNRSNVPPSTMIEEQEINDINHLSGHRDTQQLI